MNFTITSKQYPTSLPVGTDLIAATIIKKFSENYQFPKSADNLLIVLKWLNSAEGHKNTSQETHPEYVQRGIHEVSEQLKKTGTQNTHAIQFRDILIELNVITKQDWEDVKNNSSTVISTPKTVLQKVLQEKFNATHIPTTSHDSGKEEEKSQRFVSDCVRSTLSDSIDVENLDALSCEMDHLRLGNDGSQYGIPEQNFNRSNNTTLTTLPNAENSIVPDQVAEETYRMRSTDEINYPPFATISSISTEGFRGQKPATPQHPKREFKPTAFNSKQEKLNHFQNKRDAHWNSKITKNRAEEPASS